MKMPVCTALLLLLAMAATLAAPKKSVQAPQSVQVQGMTMTVGTPLTYENLTVFPVRTAGKSAVPAGYLSLDEALAEKLITVTEMPDGGEVNTLLVTSKAGLPIYLMSGDIILGGQQDRQISHDTIIPPHARKMRVDVFCVEHGRWDGAQHFDKNTVASGSLRYETQRTGSQQHVWDTVAKQTAANGAETSTGTYRAVAEGTQMKAKVGRYARALDTRLRKDPQCIGIIVAVNGKVSAADIFGNPALWRKQMSKTVKSYALDAASAHAEWFALKKRPTAAHTDATALLAEYGKGKQTNVARSKTTVNAQMNSNFGMVFQAQDASPKAPSTFTHINMYKKSAQPKTPPTPEIQSVPNERGR